jgi:hypothetical protein
LLLAKTWQQFVEYAHARVDHFQAPNLLERVVKQPAIT